MIPTTSVPSGWILSPLEKIHIHLCRAQEKLIHLFIPFSFVTNEVKILQDIQNRPNSCDFVTHTFIEKTKL
jgi:hypothetical protein